MNSFIFNFIIIIIGLIVGSFINVLVYRLPKKLPIIFSRSICPKCKSIIPLHRNIPIITYIIQNGKCHKCNESISFNYPLIEFITGFTFFIGINNYFIQEYILFLWISSILITISIIDLKTLTIPLSLLLFMLIGYMIFLFLNPDSFTIMLWGFIFGLGYLGITFIITSIIYKKQTLGYGDLLLISLIGLWLGPIDVIICIFLSALAGIIIWITRYFNGLEKTKLPFGAYLSLNAILLKILNLNIMSYMKDL